MYKCLQNYDVAREALKDMPPRAEEELDTVREHMIMIIYVHVHMYMHETLFTYL